MVCSPRRPFLCLLVAMLLVAAEPESMVGQVEQRNERKGLNHEVYPISGDQLPLFFGTRLGLKRTVTIELDPSGAFDAKLTVTAFDVNVAEEARLYVNGVGVGLPETIVGPGVSKTATVSIDPSLLVEGTNSITFELARRVEGARDRLGYRIDAGALALHFGRPAQERIEFEGDLPIDLTNRPESIRSVSASLDPSSVYAARLELSAYDVDVRSEVRILVNGTEVSVPSAIIASRQRRTARISIDAELLRRGRNEVTFESGHREDEPRIRNLVRVDRVALVLLRGGATTLDPIVFGDRLPLFFGDQVGIRRAVTDSIDPAGIEAASVTVTATDINTKAEARMYVNQTQVPLPDVIIGSGASRAATIPIDPSILTAGPNTIAFQLLEQVSGAQRNFRFRIENILLVLERGQSVNEPGDPAEPPWEETDGQMVAAPEVSTGPAPSEPELNLGGDYPDPFNGISTIVFHLSERARVGVEVFDALGRKVLEKVPRPMEAGRRSIRLHAGSLPSGLYHYRLTARWPSTANAKHGRMTLAR